MNLKIFALDYYQGHLNFENNPIAQAVKYYKHRNNWIDTAETLTYELSKSFPLQKSDYLSPCLCKTKKNQIRLNFCAKYLAELTNSRFIPFNQLRKKNLENQTIILLDDVIFTGATLRNHLLALQNTNVKIIKFCAFGISHSYNENATENLLANWRKKQNPSLTGADFDYKIIRRLNKKKVFAPIGTVRIENELDLVFGTNGGWYGVKQQALIEYNRDLYVVELHWWKNDIYNLETNPDVYFLEFYDS